MRLRRIGIVAIALLPVIGVGLFLAQKAKLGLQRDGTYLVSTGQSIAPYGTLVRFDYARPKQVALSPNKKVVAVLAHNKMILLEDDETKKTEIAVPSGPLGLVWHPRGDRLFGSLRGGKVVEVALKDGVWTRAFDHEVDDPFVADTLKRSQRTDPQPTGLAISEDGGSLYVALGIRNTVVRYDLETLKVVQSFAVGVAPYHVELQGSTLAVACRGGRRVVEKVPTQPSAGTPVRVSRNDSAYRGSVCLVDTASGDVVEIEVQRQPSGMCFRGEDELVVTEADSDSLSFIDLRTKTVSGNLSLRPKEDPNFGLMPTDVTTHGTNGLVVSCGGINALAVVDCTDRVPKVQGLVPSAWYPISIEEFDGLVYVACAKGLGSRPSDKTTKFGVHDSVGALQVAFPEIDDLKKTTLQVAKLNRWTETREARSSRKPVPIPERVGEPSVFKHVVYIIKENLTYDSTMGDIKEGNGDPSLCMFPELVTPNHHALAREFALLDNFYISGTNSADGHQWVASAVANAYMEQNYGANARSYPYDGGDPLAYSPEGFLWNAAHDAGHKVRIFGEFVNRPKTLNPATGKAATWTEAWADYTSGKNQIVIEAHTDQDSLRPHLNPRYIGFPSTISDQWRADVFLEDLATWEKQGEMPGLVMMLLPNDHTAGTNSAYPTPRAAVADNDLALGRIVEAISKSKFWKETLIVVAQDDSQLGLDHVDGHRSVSFVVSPYTRRGAVVSEVYNHTSIARTIGLVLGFPPLTRFDRVGVPMAACFTDKPDLRPYRHHKNNVPLDEMNPPRATLRGEALRHAQASEGLDLSEVDVADPATTTRAVWHSATGGKPFPLHGYFADWDGG